MFECTGHILVNVTTSQEPLVEGKQNTSILNYGFVVSRGRQLLIQTINNI